MLELELLLRARAAVAGRFDADGRRLYTVLDLGPVPQVWAVGDDPWPELVVAPPDRAQEIFPGPRPGQLVVGADVGGDERTQLLLVRRPGAQWEPLTDDPIHIHRFGSWSPDGRRVAYASNARTGRWFDVYVRDIENGETRCVLQDDSTNYAASFSPDGRKLVVQRVFSNTHDELWLVDTQGNEPPRVLSDPDVKARYDRPEWHPSGRLLVLLTNHGRDLSAPARLDVATGALEVLAQPEVEVDETALAPGGRWLAYALNRDGAAEVVVRSMADGSEIRVEGLPHGALYTYWQHGLAWDPSGTRLAITWSGSRANPNVWVYNRETGSTDQVTFAPASGLDLGALVEPEHVTYPTFDGRQIPALYYPAHAAGDAPPPCVVFVHGGPESQYRPTWQPVVEYLASAGFAVLATNVRGSTGYGAAYQHLDDVELRMDSVADLAHAAYWLRDSGRADPERIAVYGGSYGGFMVLAALTSYPELWAAGVDLVGISNFVTFLENTGPWRRHLREVEYGWLDRDRALLEEISPIHKVDRIRAPLLVIHGANDPRVPLGETRQMVERLQSLGREVELIVLADEGHQISKLKNKLHAYPRAAEFLQRHLQAQPAARF